MDVQHPPQEGRALIAGDEAIPQSHDEVVGAHELAPVRDGVAKPPGLDLARVEEADDGGVEDLGAARARLLALESVGGVEVVLDGALLAAGDDEDVAEAGTHELFGHALNRGARAEGKHLFGLGLGRGVEACAKACCRDDCLGDGQGGALRTGRDRGPRRTGACLSRGAPGEGPDLRGER